MTSPRKFAEKIALIQQKQAEDDAAFNTIITEVEAAKQRADGVSSTKRKLDVPTRKYEITNGLNHSDSNNYTNQSCKGENNNGSDRLLIPPDNPSWRRIHSDSSLTSMMPSNFTHYHTQIDNNDPNQQLNFGFNDIKLEASSYNNAHHHHQHLQVQSNHYYDLNNNNNYCDDQGNMFYLSAQQPIASSSSTNNNNTHTQLGPRFSCGNNNSNVLMLPPNQNSRIGNGGSLPDLRNGNVYNNQQLSFSTNQSQQQQQQQHFLRSPSPQENGDGDLFALGPQQQLPSRSGPLKPSPSIRRRHSPIGDGKQGSPRRQNSPTPDISSTQQNHYRVEPQSPPSIPNYSPQNSPHLLPNLGNELSPFSPQQQSTDNQQPYFTLPNHFDQINLDNNYYSSQQQPSPPSSQQNNNHSLPTTPGVTNGLRQRDFYAAFIDDMSPSYCHNQSPVNIKTNVNQKSPTIPDIILTDPDSSKLDLSKELANDFTNPFDHLIDANDLNTDFLLNTIDLSVDPNICDDAFRMEQ
ncbi:unnamed protein product [Adineta steineri]|uniref:Transducer of regulated CREB activity N-terminal domain-containing protein n=1 Tax=Adineta steineri TaxID=433720 RepID=A0A815H591_9BILA|nr:unnamed protein product [Adineta steineri]CAF1347677.1 unnamed protein product [Adineta steineri]CAF3518321.1 unnamed protein product [Adineta steineri]CAF3616992.1 unnamed protein product [Adineta steineri]